MNQTIRFKSFRKIFLLKEIHSAFIDAFSDYNIKIDMPIDRFHGLIKRRSVNLKYSIGAFVGDKIIGFILNGVRFDGERTIAYDSGTGIVKRYQGKGLGKKLLDYNLKFLSQSDIAKYLLEVISENTTGLALYTNAGFDITRKFNCYRANSSDLSFSPENEIDISINNIKPDKLVYDAIEKFKEFNISWQNDVFSIKESEEKFSFITALHNNKIIGVGVIESAIGDVPFIGVDKEYRSNKVGTAIFMNMNCTNSAEKISCLNIDSESYPINCFLESIGLEKFIQQYEMAYIF